MTLRFVNQSGASFPVLPSVLPRCAVALLVFPFLFSPAVRADDDPAARISGIDQSAFQDSIAAHDDFYLHVNGSWLDKTEIPADQSEYGIFTLLRDQSQEALRKLVEEAAAKSDNPPGSDDQKVGDLYK